jgi:myotubularin-related protein 5/13
MTPAQQAELITNEESTVYSQAIHYAYRMVYMRVPLDASKKIREPPAGMEGESLSSMVTNRLDVVYC